MIHTNNCLLNLLSVLVKNGTHIEFNIDNWFKGILDRFGLKIKLKKGYQTDLCGLVWIIALK